MEGLEAEVVRLREERDNLLWLLDHEFEERNPEVPKPDWLVFAASLREAAEAEQVQGKTRKPGVPSRQQMHEIVKARSLELQGGATQ
jgi:hypothetical protein